MLEPGYEMGRAFEQVTLYKEAWQYSSSGPGSKLKTPALPPYEAQAARPGSWAKYPGMLDTRVVKKAQNPPMPNSDLSLVGPF